MQEAKFLQPASRRISEIPFPSRESASKLMRFASGRRSRLGIVGEIAQMCKLSSVVKLESGYKSVIGFRPRCNSLRFVANSKPVMSVIPLFCALEIRKLPAFSLWSREHLGSSPSSPRTVYPQCRVGHPYLGRCYLFCWQRYTIVFKVCEIQSDEWT